MATIPEGIKQNIDGAWNLQPVLALEAPFQRRLFSVLAGDTMGTDARRGVPYVWSVSHLSDGHGLTSPRSFLAAIYSAAEDSATRYESYPYALHYEIIKRGIQKASQIRVDEIAEDYPWIRILLKPLAGMNVPCEFEGIEQAWSEKFPEGLDVIEGKALPQDQRGKDWDGIRDTLERLGLFVIRKKDKRIDMPDLYRVGFGLGRKGGVKPRT
jgi:hypothetical protein